MLENQLQITAQTTTDDELKQRLSQLIEDKHKEERTTKEAVRSLLQEKIDFQSKLSQLQVSVSTANITYTSIHLTNITWSISYWRVYVTAHGKRGHLPHFIVFYFSTLLDCPIFGVHNGVLLVAIRVTVARLQLVTRVQLVKKNFEKRRFNVQFLFNVLIRILYVVSVHADVWWHAHRRTRAPV